MTATYDGTLSGSMRRSLGDFFRNLGRIDTKRMSRAAERASESVEFTSEQLALTSQKVNGLVDLLRIAMIVAMVVLVLGGLLIAAHLREANERRANTTHAQTMRQRRVDEAEARVRARRTVRRPVDPLAQSGGY
jgi:hypothetical protein